MSKRPYKTHEAVLRQLREADLKAANAWVAELASLWDIPFKNDWIEPAEIYDFGDTLVFDMKTIRYIVTNAVTYDQVQDWQEYVNFCAEYMHHFDQPTLQEYVEARVPLVSPEAQRRITDMRSSLDRLCEEERERMNRQRLDRENMTRHVKAD